MPALRPVTLSLAALALFAGALLSFRPVYEPDLWWHLAQGREVAAGHLVHTNLFSSMYADYPQPYTPWLFDLGSYLAWHAGGGAAIQFVQMLLIAGMFALTYRACRHRAPAAAALSVLILGFFVVETRALPRPHLVSFAGVAACILLIERARAARSARPLAWALPVIAVWSNLHAESVFGVALIGLFAGGEVVHPSSLPKRKALSALGIAGASVIATMVNPYGWGLLRYLYENTTVPQVLNIAELQQPYLPTYLAFFVYVGVAAVALLVRRPTDQAALRTEDQAARRTEDQAALRAEDQAARRTGPRSPALWEAATLVVFAALGSRYLRFTPLVFLVTAPMLAERVSWLMARGIDGRALVATACAAGLAVSRVPPQRLMTGWQAGSAALAPAAFFSTGADAFIRAAGLTGPVFNSLNLGGYLAWEFYPNVTVFQDSRLQAYPPEHFRAILRASETQPAWDALVANVDWAVLSVPVKNELSGAGRFPEGDWAAVYRDRAVTILVRRTGRFGAMPEIQR